MINPHSSRQLEGRDVASLKKFPRATFLNASGFVTEDNAKAMVEAITTLKKLERLDIDRFTLEGLRAAGCVRWESKAFL